LAERAVTIVQRALGVDRDQARRLLRTAESSVPVAIVMHSAGVKKNVAKRVLAGANGQVRKAITLAGHLH
jgi:N-acetylmuramic acid 6-phosphate (MurNAc-6-P) etherase